MRESRTPQKRRGAISAEVYTEEEVKKLAHNSNYEYLGGQLPEKSDSERLQNDVCPRKSIPKQCLTPIL